MSSRLAQPLKLPCGAVIPNRLAKAAMTEGLATPQGLPTAELERLYGLWSDGGAGMLLSGNIQIDAQHLERPGNVIIDRPPNAEMKSALARWAKAGTRNGNHFWAQISHAGRQTQKPVNPNPKAPSAVKIDLPGGQFGEPVALTISEIEDINQRYVNCAQAVKEAGFTGIQIHSAHGYLLSQFLSPRSNIRQDKYGGSLENRARLLLDVVSSIRQAVGPNFPISVKLNSADFQKGGFDFEDSLKVAQWLEVLGIDLIEISGGTYEQPKLLGISGIKQEAEQEDQYVAKSTKVREAYFVDFSLAMKKELTVPLMVTGGFRRREVMEDALGKGAADIIGLGRPMCVESDAPAKLIAGKDKLEGYESSLSLLPKWLRFLERNNSVRAISVVAVQFWYYMQIDNLGKQGQSKVKQSVILALVKIRLLQHRWLKARGK